MKLNLVLCAVVACALALPYDQSSYRDNRPVYRQNRHDHDDHHYGSDEFEGWDDSFDSDDDDSSDEDDSHGDDWSRQKPVKGYRNSDSAPPAPLQYGTKLDYKHVSGYQNQ